MYTDSQLKVSKPDGLPVSGEKITIEANSYLGQVYRRQFTVANGLVEFTIDNLSRYVTYLSVQVNIMHMERFSSEGAKVRISRGALALFTHSIASRKVFLFSFKGVLE